MNISWELPTLEEARGFIDTITVTFTPTSGLQRKKRQAVMVEVPGNSTSTVIGGLNPDLRYSVTVSTSTSEGAGPEATAVVPSKNLIKGVILKLLACKSEVDSRTKTMLMFSNGVVSFLYPRPYKDICLLTPTCDSTLQVMKLMKLMGANKS